MQSNPQRSNSPHSSSPPESHSENPYHAQEEQSKKRSRQNFESEGSDHQTEVVEEESNFQAEEEEELHRPEQLHEPKKVRTEKPPSNVLFIRNLPPSTTKEEILEFQKKSSEFEGAIEKVVVLQYSKQAFVQFKSQEKATQFLNFFKGQIDVRGSTALMTYSDKTEIEAPPPKEEKPNNILLASVTETLYPITADVLHKVFSKHGNVEKIFIFHSKSGLLQGLVQMHTIEEATAAKEALDGQNIYAGCCKLRIKFSEKTDLTVTVNDDKSHDYTNPNLPTVRSNNSWPGPSPHDPYYNHQYYDPYGMYPPPYPSSSSYGYGSRDSRDSRDRRSSSKGQRGMPPMPMQGMPPPVGAYPPPMGMQGGKVLLVNGLTSKVECDDLFILFGVYGDVDKVKILPKKQNMAFIEFAHPMGADNAFKYLQGAPLFGGELQISKSIHSGIYPPTKQQLQEEALKYKIYAGSPLHRFASGRYKHYLYPPSEVLHVSNVDPHISNEKIANVFKKYGRVLSTEELKGKTESRSDKKMYLVKMDSVENAISSLVELHDYEVGEQRIKVSFSGKKLE